MMAKTSRVGPVTAPITVGIALHRLHEAVDGYEWLGEWRAWCRLGPSRGGGR